jgi:hypothetical protein
MVTFDIGRSTASESANDAEWHVFRRPLAHRRRLKCLPSGQHVEPGPPYLHVSNCRAIRAEDDMQGDVEIDGYLGVDHQERHNRRRQGAGRAGPLYELETTTKFVLARRSVNQERWVAHTVGAQRHRSSLIVKFCGGWAGCSRIE